MSAASYPDEELVLKHLGKVVDRVISEKPRDAYGLVEVLSRLVRETVPDAAAPVAPESIISAEAVQKYVEAVRQLDKAPMSDEAPAECCVIPDFMQESELLSWAGVGFDQLECYRVMCSLRNLGVKLGTAEDESKDTTKLRFWGKLLGTDADYYVAEAEGIAGPAPTEEQEAEGMEAPGEVGVNKFSYFVANDLEGEWKRLPHLTPKMIIDARKIKRLVTGNASAKVITHPYFDGSEEVLVRTTIARINADTSLTIQGMLEKDPDSEEFPGIRVPEPPEPPETIKYPTPQELLSKQAWIHQQPHILKIGRCQYKVKWEDIEDSEENPGAKAKAQEEQESDPIPSAIRGLESDGLQWSIKQAGDTTLYKNFEAENAKPRSTVVTYARSLTWPGAVTAVRGTQVVSIYVGYGLPAGEPDFFFPAPLDIQDEPAEEAEEVAPQDIPIDPEAKPADED